MLRLQSFNFRKSRYERPNHTWMCGREAREGAPCRPGPDKRGRCRATSECTPRLDGELWVCTRPRSAGGRCDDGPRPDGSCSHPLPPCQPVRTVRAKRGRAVRWTVLVTLGLLILALQGPPRDAVLSPGDLSAQHAGVADCAGCHTTAESSDGPAGWVRAAFDPPVPEDHGDGAKCLSCHALGEHPFNPHGAGQARLASASSGRSNGATNGAGGGPLTRPLGMQATRAVLGQPPHAESGVTCSACHREHQGATASLTAMSDAQCQSCHEETFASFTNGHPEFDQYAYDRRTRIRFTHVRHAQRHFDDADQAERQCGTCHTPGEAGRTMQTAGFERTCASCHAEDVRGTAAAGSPGIPVFTVPGLDVVTLRERGAGIGHWPELSDRELTPFMKMLLADDPEVRAALTRFENLDPMDLRDADQAEIETVKTVAWAVKRLLHDLVAEGPAGLRAALRAHLGDQVSPSAIRDMTAGLPLATVRRARETWFPDLAAELARHRAGETVPMDGGDGAADDGAADDGAAETGTDSPDDNGGNGGGILDGDDAGESESDGGILDGGDNAEDSQSDGGILGGDSGDAGSDSTDGQGTDDGGGILGGDSEGSGSDAAADQETENGGAILGDDAGSTDESGGTAGEGGGILNGDDGGGDDSGGGLLTDGQDSDDAERANADSADREAATMPEPDPVDWSKLGGWYRDFFAITYRPSQHADRFLTRWMDVSGAAVDSGGAGFPKALFDRLAREGGPGRCTKCHSVDRQPETGKLTVNWRTGDRGAGGDRFTSFNHDPHLTQASTDQGCATCHRFAADADYRASFDDRDPSTFVSTFQPIAKDTCATCHTAEQAGNTCTQCHEYHVNDEGAPAMQTDIQASAASR